MTPLERKIIRRAAELAADKQTCISSILFAAVRNGLRSAERGLLVEKFRMFYDVWDCPFYDWRGDPEELRTIRVLLLETFLIFDGDLK